MKISALINQKSSTNEQEVWTINMTDTRVDPKRIHKKRSRVWRNWKKLPSKGREKNIFRFGASGFLLSNFIETVVTHSCIWAREQVKTMNNIAREINGTGLHRVLLTTRNKTAYLLLFHRNFIGFCCDFLPFLQTFESNFLAPLNL